MHLSDYELNFLKRMISIPSVGGDPEPACPYGRQSKIALDSFIQEAGIQGFDTGIIDNKVGYVQFGKGTRMIGIVCHLDVVPAGSGWNTDPFELVTENGNFYGRGIVDDKGPACAAYFAMKRLKDQGYMPNCRVRLILGSDEERTCDCIETYAHKGEIPNFAITPDAEFPVIFAEKGILQIEIKGRSDGGFTATSGSAANMVPADFTLTYDGKSITATGVPAHASKPELGTNALLKAVSDLPNEFLSRSPLLSYIYDMIIDKKYSEYTGCNFNDESGTVTANPAVLRIDDSTESLIIDIRYPVSADHNEIVSFFRKQISEYDLEVSIKNHMPPIIKEKDSKEIVTLTEIWKQYISSYSGYKEEYSAKFLDPLAIGGGTYARHLPNTIAFGIQVPWQQDQCHQANEHMAVSDFETNIKVITEVIMRLR